MMKRLISRILPVVAAIVFLVPLAVSPAFAATRSLSLGMSGADVTTLQKELIAKGYLSGSATGYFGSLTQAAVEKFQCAESIICADAGVTGYGIAGPKTQSALANSNSVVAGGAQPSDISLGNLTPAATGAFEVSGWLPDWRAASSSIDVMPHIGDFTSVMPFGYGVSSTGQILDSAHIGQAPWPSVIAAAKAAKVRVIPTIMWGDGVSEQAVLSNATSRIALEDAIANLVKTNGYDGIDIDFEAKQAETKDYFSTFLKGLYQRMGSKWVYCAVEARMPLQDRYLPTDTVPSDATEYANDYTAINKYCDRVELMAYDQGTVDKRLDIARTAPYAPVADPGWVADLVDMAAQTISRNKIIVGIPTYGYEYSVTPTVIGYQYSRLWAFNPAYATGIAAQLGITPSRTSAGELGFTYNPATLAALAPSGSDSTVTQQDSTPTTTIANNLGSTVNTNQPFNYITWSDAQAMQDKITLAHQLGVRGIAFFSLGGAEDQGLWSLLSSR